MKRNRYQEDLRKQIEDQKRLQELEKAKIKEEEKRLMQKIEEEQRKMQEELEAERRKEREKQEAVSDRKYRSQSLMLKSFIDNELSCCQPVGHHSLHL